MTNFNPDKHENTINPYTISDEEQSKIVKIVDDQRLSNPPGDYFRLKLKNKNIDIPKLNVISKKTDSGKITTISTTVYINDLLKEED